MVDLLGLALLAGVAAAWLWLQPNHDETPGRTNRLGRLFWLGIVLSLLGGGADLLLRTSALTELPLSQVWPELPQVLSGTGFGVWWTVRTAAVLLLATLWLWRRAAAPLPLATAAVAILLAFVVAVTGHAGDDGALGALAVSDTLHVTAGCLWGGMVLVYAFGVAPRLRHGQATPAHVAESAVRLSNLAALALLTVLATGAYNAWTLVGSPPALWGSDYGRVLLFKLCFVAGMMAIGFHNRVHAVPRVRAWARPPQLSPKADAPFARLQRLLRMDALLFLFVLAGAAVLGGTTPPSHM